MVVTRADGPAHYRAACHRFHVRARGALVAAGLEEDLLQVGPTGTVPPNISSILAPGHGWQHKSVLLSGTFLQHWIGKHRQALAICLTVGLGGYHSHVVVVRPRVTRWKPAALLLSMLASATGSICLVASEETHESTTVSSAVTYAIRRNYCTGMRMVTLFVESYMQWSGSLDDRARGTGVGASASISSFMDSNVFFQSA